MGGVLPSLLSRGRAAAFNLPVHMAHTVADGPVQVVAKVVMIPAASTFRMQWLPTSGM
jgi:hypothetical protein